MVTQTASILKRLKNEPLRRTIPIHERAIDEKKRTVNLAFASDKPIDHWFGSLILTISDAAMRSDRLSSGAPLLMDHNMTDQIGAVEDFSIAGGVARATVRFSRSARAEEVFQDVTDGIRRSVSVGFMIHEMHLESENAGEMPVYRSDDWEPYEISLVSVPADISVGVGRSSKAGEIFMKKPFLPEDPADVNVRHNELIEWGGIFGEEQLARTMLLQNPEMTREDLRRAIQAKHDARPPQAQIPVEDPHSAAYRFGGVGYSPAVSVHRHGKLEAFKGDRAEERAHAFGQWLLAGPFGNRAAQQWCAERGLMTRAQSGLQNEKGGYLVPDQFGGDLVDLIEQYGVFRQNAKVVPMSSDRRVDPVIDGELDSQFVGELEEGDDQDLDFGLIGLTAIKHMVLVPMSSEVTEDAAISIADTVAMAAARAFAKKEDLCGFNGDGTSTYGGIVGVREKLKSVDGTIGNIQGLQVGTGNAYSELTLADFEGVCGRLPDYADMGAKWFVSRKFYFNVMVKLLLSGTPTATEIEDARNRKFLGYPVVFSQVMPSTEANSQVCAVFGNLTQGARFGDRRAVTIALDDSILFRKDALLLRATSRFDINVHGVGDTTDAGPICGLITAAS